MDGVWIAGPKPVFPDTYNNPAREPSIMRPRPPSHDKLAITTQFHVGRGTVYEFEKLGAKLSVRVSPRAADTDAGDWRVEASAAHGASDTTIVEWGPTRAATLLAVGRTWGVQGPERGLPPFDWEEVARLLTSVSAI
jgi:hypothetical protein